MAIEAAGVLETGVSGRTIICAGIATDTASGGGAVVDAKTAGAFGTSALRRTSRVCSIESNRVRSDSKSCAATASEPRYSISDSMRCAISPRRRAPARRALPLRVCRARKTSLRALWLSGRADHWRSAPPSWGINSAASSSKIGKSSASIASTASISSSSSSANVSSIEGVNDDTDVDATGSTIEWAGFTDASTSSAIIGGESSNVSVASTTVSAGTANAARLAASG